MAEPKKGIAFIMDRPLVDKLDPTQFVVNPTIAAGDFKVSVDGGGYTNLTTLPAVTPAGSRTVRFNFSATEMDGDNINVEGIDALGDQWQDIFIGLNLPASVNDDVFDIMVGDHVETSISLRINKKNTATALVLKKITGSLLDTTVTVSTKEP